MNDNDHAGAFKRTFAGEHEYRVRLANAMCESALAAQRVRRLKAEAQERPPTPITGGFPYFPGVSRS